MDFDKLKQVKRDDIFAHGPYTYRAQADAVVSVRFGFERVDVMAVRKNPAVPSGWSLADIAERRKLEVS